MKLDLDKTGLPAIYREWEIPLVEWFLENDGEMDSATALDWLNTRLHPMTVSRASVIFALQRLEGDTVLISRQETGKGGKKSIYRRDPALHSLADMVQKKTMEVIQTLQGKVN